MVGFLRWLRSIAVGTLNGVVRFVFLIVLIFLDFSLVGLRRRGLPGNMVLALDLRGPIRGLLAGQFQLRRTPVT